LYDHNKNNQKEMERGNLMSITGTPAWTALHQHRTQIQDLNILEQFQQDPQRLQRFSLSAAGLHLDYSKNRITPETLELLIKLAEQQQLPDAIRSMFDGEPINITEQRPALHTALRNLANRPVTVQGQDVMADVRATLNQMEQFCQKVADGSFAGYTGKPLRTIVNIGIGGSFLGPRTVSNALKPYWQDGYDLKYLANIDGTAVSTMCETLDPETTLFVVCSKSFGTLETLKNAQACRQWFLASGATEQDIRHHFVAVTTNTRAATEFGIDAENLFPLWDWVGGRYSLWSAIGLSVALVLGFDRFKELLAGAQSMDEHFRSAPLNQNIPVILALLGIWYHNFQDADSHAVVVYDDALSDLPAHLQQLDMESNGKQVQQDGTLVDYKTGPIIWGGTGCNDQHAYFQLLHQGTRLIPCDFIMPLQSHYQVADHHQWLFANFVAQQNALMVGRQEAEVRQELEHKGLSQAEIEALTPHKIIPGNRPCNSITLDKLTPETVGALIALYEHKVFVQGILWNIDSFDQWGVELGKQIGNSIYAAINSGDTNSFDASTAALIQQFKNKQQNS
jgi:glucose-6-phosphate isomerase